MSLRGVVLGLLDLAPMSGYDLKKSFDSSARHFWAADQSQLYRTLSGLVADGRAEVSVVVQDGKPNRKVHKLTAAGRDELDQWLTEGPGYEPERDPFLARLFFAGRLGKPAVVGMIGARRAEATRRLAELESIEVRVVRGDRRALLRRATLRQGIAHLRAEIAWLDETLAAL